MISVPPSPPHTTRSISLSYPSPTSAALSSSELSDLGTVVSAFSTEMERSSGLSLLHAVHASFPLAMLDCYNGPLLRHNECPNVRKGILIPGVPLSTTLSVAQKAFFEVVQLGSALTSPATNAISFCGNDSATNFDEIYIDCLINLTAPADSNWTRDPASSSDIFHIRQTGHEPLMPAPCSADAAAAATMSGGRPDMSASFIDDNVITDSALQYRPGAKHYVIGEKYEPLSPGERGATSAIQKLLKLERILCVIQAKEGIAEAADICRCVLGVVLIGPSMDSATCASVFATLSHYKSSLQRLWAISEAKRLFAIRLQPLVTQLLQGLHEMEAGIARVEAKKDATRQEVAAIGEAVAAMRTALTELSANAEAKDAANSAKLAELEASMKANAAANSNVLAELSAQMEANKAASQAESAAISANLAELSATMNAKAAATSTKLAELAATMEAREAASRAEAAANRIELTTLSAKVEAIATAAHDEAAANRTKLAEISAQIGAILALLAASSNGGPRRDGGGGSHL